MRTLKKVLLGVLVFLVVLTLVIGGGGIYLVRRNFPQTSGTLTVPGLQAEVRVLRDEWGIPHIYAQNNHDLFFAQGYVHAQDRMWQMEFWRRIGMGRLSEILGKSALDSDKFLRTVGFARVAEEELRRMDPMTRNILQAYADGVTAYIQQHKGRLGIEFTLLGLTGVKFDPEPWSPVHSLTWAKVMAYDLGGNMDSEIMRAVLLKKFGTDAVQQLLPAYRPDHPVIVPTGVAWQDVDTSLLAVLDEVNRFAGREVLGTGSNNWVIAGSKTTTGAPLLANDPHLAIQMPSIWYEIGLHGGDFDVVGSSFPGAPGVIIGHNRYIAWGVTNLGPDTQDLFVERINPNNPNQYEFQGEWRDMQVIQEEIRVAGQSEPVKLTVRITHHGPIVNDVMGPLPTGTALRWTALEPNTLFQAVVKLDLARNWDEFRNALREWDIAGQNFVYADVQGNIGYQSTGKWPIRAHGDGLMPVPGHTGEYDWLGYVPFEEMPYLFNPSQGFVVTANHAVVDEKYPYLVSLEWSSGYRAARITQLIQAKAKLSAEDIQAIQADTLALGAKEILPYFLNLKPQAHELRQALEILKGWDYRFDKDSAGAAIFGAVVLHLVRDAYLDEMGASIFKQYFASSSMTTVAIAKGLEDPNWPWFDDKRTAQVETRDDILLRALKDAVDDLTKRLGPDMPRWKWGSVHTATFRNQSLGKSGIAPIEALLNRGPVPVNGAGEVVNNTPFNIMRPYEVSVLPSYRQIIDLADFTRSLSMHTTGQSGHTYHKRYDDMILYWRDVKYHPMLWTREQVERAAVATLVLIP
ncbi:MAG: penicillin acylase family protein [Anaerolineae bacterium]|nr:penicillin acylase family protein [Anaerolineae bacterium]